MRTPHIRWNFTASVVAFSTALCGVSVALLLFGVDHSASVPLHLPVATALFGMLIAGLTPLMLEVQSNTFSISLTEIPIVVCLLSMQRVPMVIGATVGWFVALLLSRRRAPLKLFFNTSLIIFELVAPAAIIDATVSAPGLTRWTTWVAVVAGITLTSIVASNAVNLVIRLAGDNITAAQVLRHTGVAVANAAAGAMLTLLAIMALEVTAVSAIPLVILAVTSIVPLRRHAKLTRRYEGLLLLHEFTAGLTGSTDLGTTLTSVLSETSKVLRSSNAVILLRREDEFRMSHASENSPVAVANDFVWNTVIGDGLPLRLERGSTAGDGYLDATGIKDLMGVPLLHGDRVIGALLVLDRLGETSTFDDDDLSIFGTMANQTTVTLENLRLIDELRDESAERKHQAFHDELTGLPNRAHLYATLDERLAEGPAAVAVLDLNRFKEVNDTLGHHAGDQVLIHTAHRLRHALPSSTFIARLGGDEFAIVLFGVSRPSDAVARLSALELAFSQPIVLDAMSLRVDASIGVAVSPEHGTDRESLLRRADVAMYAAKHVRGTTVRSYERSQEHSSKRSLEIVGALRKAIDDDALDVFFQPKASLAHDTIVGAEALARWNHPTLGQVTPDEFIPIAEQAGLIDALTNVVLRRSLEACAGWRAAGHLMTVAVNVDAQTLLTPGFVDVVLGALSRWNLPPNALTIEITERELVRELDAATEVISELRSFGVYLSIDDFGTGYSSLAYLSRLPVDEVKIDRAFVVDVIDSPVHEAIIRAITDIADKLGATTVIEGVEDSHAWDLVTAIGATYAQGYFLARPMPDTEFRPWLAARAASVPRVGEPR